MLAVFLLGSKKDMDHAQKIADSLDGFGVPYKIHIGSAHKVPELVLGFVKQYEKEEDIVYVTIAGRSNALSGFTGANTAHPVVACPPFSSKEDYLINIHSTLQMPSETPVLTVLDTQNAALAVAKIFALKDADLRKRIQKHMEMVKNSFKE